MNIALCLCTRNRPDDLRRALASVQASTLTPIQVLVSDDSDPLQAQAVRSLCADCPGVTYCRGPRRGVSANKNHCLSRLRPAVEAVSFIDDDVILHPDFLRLAMTHLASAPPQTIITGRECKNGWDVTPHNCSFWGHQEQPPRGPEDYHTIVLNATLFPHTLFSQARFDEALRYGSEEADLCAQAEALGYRIQFCPELINDHHPSPVNRAEYAQVVEASRLYATYKNYRWLECRPGRAAAFAMLAPLHLLGSVLKARQFVRLPHALAAIGTAARLIHAYGKARP